MMLFKVHTSDSENFMANSAGDLDALLTGIGVKSFEQIRACQALEVNSGRTVWINDAQYVDVKRVE